MIIGIQRFYMFLYGQYTNCLQWTSIHLVKLYTHKSYKSKVLFKKFYVDMHIELRFPVEKKLAKKLEARREKNLIKTCNIDNISIILNLVIQLLSNTTWGCLILDQSKLTLLTIYQSYLF